MGGIGHHTRTDGGIEASRRGIMMQVQQWGAGALPPSVHTCLLFEFWPWSLFLPLLDEVLDRDLCDARYLGFKAYDLLDLLVR